MKNLAHYHTIADLFDFPDAAYPKKITKVIQSFKSIYPAAAAETAAFYEQLPKESVDRMQELYTRSFDVQAITTLDVGYVLFGDDYKRGEILSNLNREHNIFKINCGVELADHLPNVLRLLAKLEDEELIQDLIREIVAPAVLKMIREFDPLRVEAKNKLYKKHYKTLIETSQNSATIYQHTLKALFAVLKQDFKFEEKDFNQELNDDFLNAIGTEMFVEKVAKE